RLQVPEPQYVAGGGREGPVDGRKTYSNYPVAMAKGVAQSDLPLPEKFPEYYRAVPAGGGEPAAVGAEGNLANLMLVRRKGETVPSLGIAGQRSSVPDTDGVIVIVAGGCEAVTVGTERQVIDSVGVRVKRE